ncbi:histone-binding protein N1/N2-like [Tropilaelaps mercedesae]|uniref:Histone-binding protein N1/N2-like n=1 Tax=Tropilaelaps mercedesae TaxID=418985 RepID=A0A1V9XPK5_9ACAR|nr:histone-binding protein N1/N2-like [Tropilaelaps mercedesae]
MTAAEASIVVKDDSNKKDASNTETPDEKNKLITGIDNGNKSGSNDEKSLKSTTETGKKDSDSGDESSNKKDSEAKGNGKMKPETTDQTEDIVIETDSKQEEKSATMEKIDKKDGTSDDADGDVKESEDLAAEAKTHLVQGKRNMLVQDYSMAVESLQKACELLAVKYGDDASQCAEALHYYGKALLELHRKESGALNDIDNQEGSKDDSNDENDNEDKDEQEEEETNEKKESDGSSGEEKAEDDNGELLAKDEEDLETENEANDGDKEAQDGIGDEEDVSNLQIAFEVLELAKKIYKRDAEKDPQLYLKAADCLLALGEINLESDTYDRAIEDFEECLRIQQEMLPRDARVMAETNYQLGLAYSFLKKFEQSAAYFGDSIQILELKVINLNKRIEDAKQKGASTSDESDDIRRSEEEIEEIQHILPEIAAKMEDAKESQRDSSQEPTEKIIGEIMRRASDTSPVKKETKVNVISSDLIKRKRPLSEDTDNQGGQSSKEHANKKLKEN